MHVKSWKGGKEMGEMETVDAAFFWPRVPSIVFFSARVEEGTGDALEGPPPSLPREQHRRLS